MSNLVSIILPVYNGEKYISQAIESVLKQTYDQLELIIVNDCSTDRTLKIITEFAISDKRVIVVNNENNKKLPASLNIGHKQAKGSYVTWTSDDNILLPNFLEKLVDILITKKADVVYSNYEVINELGEIKRKHKARNVEGILFGNVIGASFLYKKEVYDKLGGYDEALFLLEDYDFWLRASMNYKFYHLDEILYKYRLHSDSLTSNIHYKISVKEKHQKGALKMYGKISNELLWEAVTLDFIVTNFLNQTISIKKYFDNKNIIDNDIFKFNTIYFNKDKVKSGLYLLLRKHLLAGAINRNLATTINVLKRDKHLLFNSSFSKKSTFKYILKSIFNF